jgi:DNA-directed RNA polymerase specialized sigma subunit
MEATRHDPLKLKAIREWDAANPPKYVMDERQALEIVYRITGIYAARYRMEPKELWGAGWLGAKTAEARYDATRGHFLPFLKAHVEGEIRNSLRRKMQDEAISLDSGDKTDPSLT